MRHLIQLCYRQLLGLLPATWALAIIYYRAHGRWPNLVQPKTFNEKVQYRKLHQHDLRFPNLADKALAKEYVAKVLGSEWVIPTLWVGTHLPPRTERRWPLPYVLKATHGSSTNVFVRSEAEQDWDRIEPMTKRWLTRVYGRWAREWLYTKIEPRLLVEPFVSSNQELPLDYKLFVFAGVVRYIQIDTGRERHHRRVLYTPHWERLEVRFGVDLEPESIPQPKTLSSMIGAAEQLGKDFDFVRIDFYEINGRPKFGEMTFYPDSGLGTFTPRQFDATLGSYWNLQGTKF